MQLNCFFEAKESVSEVVTQSVQGQIFRSACQLEHGLAIVQQISTLLNFQDNDPMSGMSIV